ncbi:MAG: hypothetical protein AB7S26_20505 [Sandaracinaceae bacterium]
MRRACAAAVLVMLGTGCQRSASTELLVAFDVDPALRDRATRIEASSGVLDGDAVRTVANNTFELADARVDWPYYALRLVPTGDSREVQVDATLHLDDGIEPAILAQSIRAEYVDGESRQVVVRFDQTCATDCGEGLRCFEGACVERCVESVPTDATIAPSSPRACGAPCEASECDGEAILDCVDGLRILRERCALGCNQTDRCDRLLSSNEPKAIEPDDTFGDLVVPSGYWVTVQLGTRAEPVIRVLDESSGDMFEVAYADQHRSRPVQIIVGPDIGYTLPRDVSGYVVVEVHDLVVERGGDLALGYGSPVIFLVHGVARIEGVIHGENNRAGYHAPAPAGAQAGGNSSGGGGGGHALPGGAGGASGTVPGGEGGPALADDDRLVPLVGGSAGGLGGGVTGAADQHSQHGGAMQISAAVAICLGPVAELRFYGESGDDATATTGACGGGSGGAVLLESPEIYVSPREQVAAAIDVTGGRGGRGFTSDGQISINSQGDADTTGAGGGAGANRAPGGAGGGGGSGRVEINTIGARVENDLPCPGITDWPAHGLDMLVTSPPGGPGIAYGEPRTCSTVGGPRVRGEGEQPACP